MIGQNKIKEAMSKFTELPRFMIFEGIKGCGKKTLAKELSKRFELEILFIGNKIDNIREMINLANDINSKVLFVIDEGDNMSIGAKNTLLKITEEAPNNSYIILNTENKQTVLPTLLSRGTIFSFEGYTALEFKEYCEQNNLPYTPGIEIAYPSFGYIDLLPTNKAQEMIDYCVTILKSIRKANMANCFKITEKLKIKETDNGWDILQFISCLYNVCSRSLLENIYVETKWEEYNVYLEYLTILSKIKAMYNRGKYFNKNFIVNLLILELKGVV